MQEEIVTVIIRKEIERRRGHMRILLCDDDGFILQQLTNYLNEYFQKTGAIRPEIVCYRDGESLLADQGEKDIIFLDIELGGLDGIYVGAELKKQDKNIILFIITAFPEYLDEAMRFHVFRYLSKPIDRERLFRNLKDAIRIYMASVVRLAIETKDGIHTVNASEIILVEACGRIVTVHTTKKDYLSVKTMSYWINTLCEKCFYQTHRSFIVNMEYVNDFDHTLISLYHDQFKAYLTRRKYSSFKKAYMLYLESTRK